jgi:threonine/homoserine/homoserine lactone efflux protein
MAVALSLVLVCLVMFGVSVVVGVFIGWLDDRRSSAWAREETASRRIAAGAAHVGQSTGVDLIPARHRSVA